MHRLACHLAGDGVIADDIVQQALLTAWRHRSALRDEGAARAWLARIVRTTWLDRRPFREHVLTEDAADRGAGPADRLDAVRLGAAVDRALATLPDDQRDAVWLVDALGFSFAEVAETMDIAPGTAASRVARGRATLRELLAVEAREWGIR
jgi:RNA polymerase sigma-70 factor (ECF subfamily)